jgi:cell fate (sporulation/competence/biofilm development) regulator YlbF (YheA/YmcA/DUF963 family)
MLTQIEDGIVLQKTKELCQAILDQPAMASARLSVSAFLDDERARTQYQDVMTRSEELQRTQQSGLPLSPEELSAFEDSRHQLMSNPVARSFLDAQEQMRQVHQTVNEYVGKTLELGRLPTSEDFHSECCGDGCACEH